MKRQQLLLIAVLAGAGGACGATSAEDNSVSQQKAPAALRLPVEGELPSIDGATGWPHSLSPFRRGLVSVEPQGAEVAADWTNVRSPESYVGYEHTETFASPGGAVLTRNRVYAIPTQLRLNEWALAGDWAVQSEAVVLSKAEGRVAYRFHARDLNLVMGPVARGTPVKFRVLIDGQPPAAAHGVDVDEQGYGTVAEPRMYQLIRQTAPIADREFEVEFLGPDVQVFDFTFG